MEENEKKESGKPHWDYQKIETLVMHGCYSAKGSKDIKLTVNLHAGFLIIVVSRITNNNQHTEHSNQIMEKLTVKIPKELTLMLIIVVLRITNNNQHTEHSNQIQYRSKGLQHYTHVKSVYYTHITRSVHAPYTQPFNWNSLSACNDNKILKVHVLI